MSHDEPTLERRAFLKTLSVGTAALGGGVLLDGCASHQVAAAASPSVVNAAPLKPASDAWDMSWIERLKSPHRIAFDNPQIAEGAVLAQAENWLNGFAAAYGAKDSDLNLVLVIRHSSVPMVVTPAMWTRLGTAGRQPDIRPLMERGAIVLACNYALRAQASKLVKEGLSSDAAYKEVRAAVIPGVYVMPNGIFAVGRAQEVGCTYFRAG